jgi:hypothetical protein
MNKPNTPISEWSLDELEEFATRDQLLDLVASMMGKLQAYKDLREEHLAEIRSRVTEVNAVFAERASMQTMGPLMGALGGMLSTTNRASTGAD